METRIIKFRGWHTEANKMLFVGDDSGTTHSLDCAVYAKNQPVILMQYTGLKDKNGVEIYEGDVVSVDNSEPEENGQYDVLTQCKWEIGGFVLEDIAGGHWTRQLYHQPHRLTVIGNIYEHPHLLNL